MFAGKFIKDYLTFKKNDRTGILALVGLILIIYFLPVLFSKGPAKLAIKGNDALQKAIDTLEAKSGKTAKKENGVRDYYFEPQAHSQPTVGPLFRFDPNTLSVEGWQKLGLTEKTSRTIERYRNKGGKFHKPEDIQKIWGIPGGFYERVRDYIEIEPPKTAVPYSEIPKPAYEKPRYEPLDVNLADTGSLIALPGIGSKLASRILNFREKLGGFYSVEQVAETYGLPDSTFQKIRKQFFVAPTALRKLNINTATKDELKIHPYLRWALASAIVEFRNQHGLYRSLDDLRNIPLVSDSLLKKIIPYLNL